MAVIAIVHLSCFECSILIMAIITIVDSWNGDCSIFDNGYDYHCQFVTESVALSIMAIITIVDLWNGNCSIFDNGYNYHGPLVTLRMQHLQ